MQFRTSGINSSILQIKHVGRIAIESRILQAPHTKAGKAATVSMSCYEALGPFAAIEEPTCFRNIYLPILA